MTRVLFVCVQNAGRSQMAQAFYERRGGHARSAGSAPADEVHPVVVEAMASSPLVRLTAASFAVNGKKWVNVFPSDGLFDSKSETFRFQTEPLKPGTYVLVLRVRDAAGNTGSGDVVFTVPLKK